MNRAARARLILSELGAATGSWAARPHELVRACASELQADGVGISLVGGGSPAGLLAASGRLATEVEDLQLVLGEGPCVESVALGRPVLVPDLTRLGSRRWPAFAEGAARLDVAAVFVFPLLVGRVCLGVLGTYHERPCDLPSSRLAAALAYADAATALLLQLQARARTEGDGLATVEVLEDRAEVHQATGVVAVQAEVGLAEALLLLRSRAFADGLPLLHLARAVLAHEVRFAPEAPPSVPQSEP